MESKRKKGHTVDSRSLGQSSITGCDSTTKQTCFLKRCFFGDGNYRVFGYDGVLGESGASHLIISSHCSSPFSRFLPPPSSFLIPLRCPIFISFVEIASIVKGMKV